MILISALAAALLPCLPLLANAQARNTLNVQTYTPEQTTVKDTICELFQGSTRGGVWPETIHSPIDTWNLFEVTPKLVEYLEANGKDDFATNFIASATAGRVQRTSPIVCNTITDSCDVPFDCDGYDSFESALVVWSIYALRKSTDRQDAAYVEAHAKFAENDNDLAKVVFRDTQFGDDVKDIQRRLFIGAITNMFSFIGGVVGGSVIKGLFALIRETAKFLVKEAFSDFDIGNDPVNDGTAFVNSLQASYTEIRDLLKIIVENYMRNGDVDFALISTPQQTVEFLQSGAMLPLMSESALAAFKDKTRDDLIKQTALPFIASIYQEQGLRIRISNAPPERCNPPEVPAGLDGFILRTPFFHGDVPGVGVKCLKSSHQLGQTQSGALGRFGMRLTDILMNAAVCAANGGAGVFPPTESEQSDAGFPRCSFPWSIEDGSEI